MRQNFQDFNDINCSFHKKVKQGRPEGEGRLFCVQPAKGNWQPYLEEREAFLNIKKKRMRKKQRTWAELRTQ